MNKSSNLISKYLPKKFSEFQMDSRVIQLLTRLISADSLSILLISRSGCGKTSLINTIVRTYFDGHAKTSENVLVVNSAKEQGVAFYRSHVRTFCQSLPTVPNKKRVVILDDIDILSDQTQQLFRTCIDQFSKSVHFVASCTDQQKVSECLQSRLLSVKVPILEPKSLEKIATRVICGEGLTVSGDALRHIITVSQGSARSVISYLEKAVLIGCDITLEMAEMLCTDIAWKEFEVYVELVKNGETLKATKLLCEINGQGFSVMDILDNFFCFLKQTDIIDVELKYKLIPVLCKYLMRLHETFGHVTELAFFTRSAINTIKL